MIDPESNKVPPKTIYKSKLRIEAIPNQDKTSIKIIKKTDQIVNNVTLGRGFHYHNSSFPLCQTLKDNDLNLFNNSLYSGNENEKSNSKKTLVLDLDETLIHSTQELFPKCPPNYTLLLPFDPDQPMQKVYIYIRPFLSQFLERMAKKYELMVFTASQPSYANAVIDLIDKNKLISMRYYRHHCRQTSTCLLKDLAIINRDLKGVIIVDNNPKAYSFYKENGIPINTWICDRNDTELSKLASLLDFLNEMNDVRRYIPLLVDRTYIDYSKFHRAIEMKRTTEEQSKVTASNNELGTMLTEGNLLQPKPTVTNNGIIGNQMLIGLSNRLFNDNDRSGSMNHWLNVNAVCSNNKDCSPAGNINLPLMNLAKTNTRFNFKPKFMYKTDKETLPSVKRCFPRLINNNNIFNYKLRQYTDKGFVLKTEGNSLNK